MPRKQRLRTEAPRTFAYRGHWLSKHASLDAWCITWYERDARQTRRASLGTVDVEEAKERLIACVDERRRLSITAPNQVLIAQVVQRYVGGHGQEAYLTEIKQRLLRHEGLVDSATENVASLPCRSTDETSRSVTAAAGGR